MHNGKGIFMKKNIYTGIFCTILGLCINTPANASIISRSFLDEALTDYATTTALDLKANQSDFTDLNTQIRDSVDLLRQLLVQGGNSYKFVNNINPEKFPNTISGAFGLLYQYLDMFAGSILYGWTDENGTSYAGFDALNNGWTDSEKNTYLGVKGLNDKIGTLPSGSLLGNSPAMDALFISTQGTNIPVFPNSLSDLINQLYGSTEGPGAISTLLHGFDFTLGEYNGPVGVLPAMELGLSATQIANRAKALAESNATAIGTLPTEYATVGAALSAIKGIAEEAKAAALAAIPDPKTEGSNGKYVLTVDIIGDNATYRWEPIDRSKTTATTE